MPILKSAKKAARQSEKRTKHNIELKKNIKAALKLFRTKPTAENLSKAQSEYDKAVKKDLMKKNTASRRKSALAKIAKSAGVKPATKAKKVEAKPTAKPAKAEVKTTKTVTKTKAAKLVAKKPVAKSATKTTAKKTTAKKA